MAKAETPILMSPQNPEGWKLEELLRRTAEEVEGKTAKISQDHSLAARRVAENNGRIVALLARAAAIQDESMAALAAVGPDQGPLGKPRIGPGSES
jgi:hypothetical protein